jgi:putative selenate reductase molybdopterin-binding subunit
MPKKKPDDKATNGQTHHVEVAVTLNGQPEQWHVAPGETLMETLRKNAIYSVKHGCETGECGACAVLVDGVPRTTCVMLTAQAQGRAITTVESLGTAENMHLLQQEFLDSGAIQCGYCTPAMILSALELLRRNADPTAADVQDAFSGNLCRCTGYHKPVQAVLSAARKMREGARL